MHHKGKLGLEHLRLILTELQVAGLHVNTAKSTFSAIEKEYLRNIIPRISIKPHQNNVQAILSITLPIQVKDLCSFLYKVQFYSNL